MYFRMPGYIGLRSWQLVPYAYLVRYTPYAQPLTKREFETMLMCDGEHDIEFDETVAELAVRKLIVSCEKGEHPSEWSLHKSYDNRYFPKMNLMITGKCNYNCLHCFNAADNAPLMTEWTFEELCDLFDQARGCGVHALTITGGEPMVHKRFMDILREIHKRDMFVEELNTNGYYITQEILDEMKEIGCCPLIKISFDGIGYHDWMRDRKGAEQKTLDAMKLCIDNGFRVKAQTQVHRKNVDSMMPTARVLCDMGVDEMRIIRTTEVPRWYANAGDACLGMEEYYEKLLAFARDYINSDMKMEIDIWQFLRLHASEKSFHIVPVTCAEGEYRDTFPGCRGNRGMLAVTSSGDAVPCMQASGLLMQLNIHLGNVHKDRLKDLLTSGEYLDNVCATVGDVRKNNPKCGACKWFEYCTGGCRAMGLLYSGERKDFCGEDLTKCRFFENGWYERTSEALAGWKNLSRINT
ncbi:MAG: radical SAM protein [Ruminiclostridium sp.]|nr:radical SAM protein [Ruminiclostridium sp.]